MPTGDHLREIALSLPETRERETWGHPTFRVHDKMFASMSDDGTSATVKASREEQKALIAEAPETFTYPAYVGQHGWVGVDLTRIAPDHLRELVTEAWRMTAPKRVVRAFDTT
jgi:hypothetical protein